MPVNIFSKLYQKLGRQHRHFSIKVSFTWLQRLLQMLVHQIPCHVLVLSDR